MANAPNLRPKSEPLTAMQKGGAASHARGTIAIRVLDFQG
jgi:hypothetical protein